MAYANGKRRGQSTTPSARETPPRRTARTLKASELRAPGFVLCPARSGSTLLRLILNSHPEIACPPETNLVQVFSAVAFSAAAAGELGHVDQGPAQPDETMARAAAICRDVGETILGLYAETRGKSMWVDKSLPSVFFGDLLVRIYPDARFICLYRQCADTIASLREASPWSYDSFGVLPFVQASPTNLVQAFAAYWVERASQLQTFEHAHPHRALRVRYEDLVATPRHTVTQVLEFLGVSADQEALDSALAFEPRASAAVPGDVKVRFSRGIDVSSVGRGWSVPFDMLTSEMRERIDELSRDLGYSPLPNLKQYVTEPATSLLSAAALARPYTRDMTKILEECASASVDTPPIGRDTSSSLMKLVVTDISEPWMVDLTSGRVERRDGAATWLAVTDSATLMSLVSGQVNPGIAMRDSSIHVVSASDEARPDEFLDCVDELMTVLRR
jgi:protein-tyrosine sulfotransferase